MTDAVTGFTNFLLIAGLGVYGLALFGDYAARGRWAKNVTSLLAAAGVFMLALALVFTPANAAILLQISKTRASRLLLGVSSFLLLLSIVAFGVITYSRPLRLRHEKKIDRDLSRGRPNLL